MRDVVLVDTGVANIASVRRAFERLGAAVCVSSDPERVATASRVLLPGVGAFAPAAARLRETGLDEALRSAAARGARILGLCLGYQLLFEESEEFGTTRGLGFLPGRIVPLPDGARTPHIGWNRLDGTRSPLFEGVPDGSFVYFNHSYRAFGVPREDLAATCAYGGGFPVAVARENVWGCQFHPEKSSATGRRILRNFLVAE